MTADELQSIARRLSNSSWCRYWLNFYDSSSPVWMAIQCRDETGKAVEIQDIEPRGFSLYHGPNKFLYMVQRTNEDGSLFVSKLFSQPEPPVVSFSPDPRRWVNPPPPKTKL